MPDKDGEQDVRLRLLRVERVDVAAHEHVTEDEILQHLHSLRTPALVKLLEALKEVRRCLSPVLFS